MTTPRILLDEPITFDVGDGKQTHAPMVNATIHGTPTKLILDTGSTDHLLTVELAGQVGLELAEGEEGTDSTGASVPSWSVGDVPVEIGGLSFTLGTVVGINGPPPFIQGGIGGIVSPQHLHPTAWAVLDLAGERFLLIETDGADPSAWLTETVPGMRLLRLDREPGDETILVQAAIEPFRQVVTMLDTGGKRTEMVAGIGPGLAAGPLQVIGHGVGGGESFGSEVADQTLLACDARIPVERLILRDAMEDRDLLVGMDVLRGMVLAVHGDPAKPVLWMVPA
jgi:hypothetical protein